MAHTVLYVDQFNFADGFLMGLTDTSVYKHKQNEDAAQNTSQDRQPKAVRKNELEATTSTSANATATY